MPSNRGENKALDAEFDASATCLAFVVACVVCHSDVVFFRPSVRAERFALRPGEQQQTKLRVPENRNGMCFCALSQRREEGSRS